MNTDKYYIFISPLRTIVPYEAYEKDVCTEKPDKIGLFCYSKSDFQGVISIDVFMVKSHTDEN